MKATHLVLIGFMGSGKTTVGRRLAEALNLPLTDMDALIEARAGMAIREIFRQHGEAHFRALERQVVQELAERAQPGVTCTGGGVVLDERNVADLKGSGTLIWLKASPEETLRRVTGDRARPLLQDKQSVEGIGELLDSRLALYAQAADLTVDTDGKTVDDICREILRQLELANHGTPDQ